MALGPKEFDNSLNVAKKTAELERYIDAQLSEKYGGEHSVTVEIPSSPNILVQQAITQKYAQAGWGKVEFEHSQKDGDWIRFTK